MGVSGGEVFRTARAQRLFDSGEADGGAVEVDRGTIDDLPFRVFVQNRIVDLNGPVVVVEVQGHRVGYRLAELVLDAYRALREQGKLNVPRPWWDRMGATGGEDRGTHAGG